MYHPQLTSRTYAVLLALSSGERHGYDITRQVAEDSDDRILLGPATLYTTLKRLLEQKLISESNLRTDAAHDTQRRYYALTASGKAALQDELVRLERFSQIGRTRLA